MMIFISMNEHIKINSIKFILVGVWVIMSS